MLEPDASTDRHPVFVDDGRRRNQVGRLATTTFGLMLAAWLAALAAGVIGSGPFPQLSLLGADHEQAVQGTRPQTSDNPLAGRATSRNVGPPSSSNSEPRSGARIHPGTGASSTREPGGGTATREGGTATGGDGAAPPTVGTRDTPTQVQPPGATTTQTPSVPAPSPTAPESGQQSAVSSGPSATTSPDVASGTTSPDGSGTPTSTVGSGTTDAPDAPISDSLPTG
jgi:hypothetical protein